MATPPERKPEESTGGGEPRRWQQWIFDDLVVVIVLGLLVPTIFYIALGVIDLVSVPEFQP